MNGTFFVKLNWKTLIYADSFESCLNSVNFIVDLFKYFGIKANFAKSSLIPSQTTDFLGYSLDARECRFTLLRISYLSVGLSLSVFLDFALLELTYCNVSWVF